MKHLLVPLLAGVMLLWPGAMLYGEDMRTLQRQVLETRRALEQQAAADREAAARDAAEVRERILKDKAALERSIAELQAGNRKRQGEVEALNGETTALAEQEEELIRDLAESDGMVRELVGVIRINAKDLYDLVIGDPQNGVSPTPVDFLKDMADQTAFPGMPEIRRMVDLLFSEIAVSGEVSLARGPIIDRSGHTIDADILTVGGFSAAYRVDGETGFLEYLPADRNFHALSRLPAHRLKKQIDRYMQGRGDVVAVDVSRGAALAQLAHGMNLWQQVGNGGPLVWPILAIFILGAAMTIERVVFLLRRRFDADTLLQRMAEPASRRDWNACRKMWAPVAGKPVARVIQAGLAACSARRREMEDALQEAILREIPAMERFLATLGMLAAIAPLLGLLGTVTGMIDTFQVITRHGTGDPRMMSGGISVALVTTMLGLAVAIPVMLAHTLLGRATYNFIGQMEEKAVALVNMVHKTRSGDGCLD